VTRFVAGGTMPRTGLPALINGAFISLGLPAGDPDAAARDPDMHERPGESHRA